MIAIERGGIMEKRYGNMISIFELAKWFLSMESMSNLKLQKMCYYAQAWHLALFGSPLVDTQFEAWVHGPVSRELYRKYKDWGWYDISKYTGSLHIDEDTKEFLEFVYSLYGDLSGNQLEDLTHKEAPWINARGGLPRNEVSHNIISDMDMMNYYRQLIN